MERLISLDKELLLAINGAHTEFLDTMMVFFSSIPVWIPLYVLIVALLFIKPFYSRKSCINSQDCSNLPIWIMALVSLLGILLCFGLCDQISYFFKEHTYRLRPSHDPELIVRAIDGLGSQYGFFSGHAANTFGLAILSSLLFRRYIYSILMLLWAATVSYSRMYLAQHFPIDITCGIILGIIVAFSIYYLILFILKKLNNSKYFHQ